MVYFYKVAYSDNGRVMFTDFDFLNEALEFIRKVRAKGERANLQKFPRIEW